MNAAPDYINRDSVVALTRRIPSNVKSSPSKIVPMIKAMNFAVTTNKHCLFRFFAFVFVFFFLLCFVVFLVGGASLYKRRIWGTEYIIGSLRNHDDDCNNNVTNLHIWYWKTIVLHALHVQFIFDITQTFSFFLRREMTCFAVVWTTSAYDDKCSILSSYLWSAGSNLIPG